MRVFMQILKAQAALGMENDTLMVDATFRKAIRTASSSRLTVGEEGRLIGMTKGGRNSGPNLVGDGQGYLCSCI